MRGIERSVSQVYRERDSLQDMHKPGDRKWRIPGGKAAARLREFRMLRGLTDVPAGGAASTYFAAMQQRNQQMAALDPEAPQPRWSPVGPFSIPHGQTYGKAQPAVSGRVSCIAVDPKAPAHILVGSGSGASQRTADPSKLERIGRILVNAALRWPIADDGFNSSAIVRSYLLHLTVQLAPRTDAHTRAREGSTSTFSSDSQA